jgi:predicted amidohydrolase YtcJ
MESILYHNGTIITCDPALPRAEAVIVEGERIAFVGRLDEALRRLAEPSKRVDLGGRTMIPGFNDNHVHAFGLGILGSQLNLYGKSAEEICELVREKVSAARPGELIVGHDWDYGTCPSPHRKSLDAVAPNHPVLLLQCSGHGVWLNSYLLRRAGITRGRPDLPGRLVHRDEDGEPTGIIAGNRLLTGTVFLKYLAQLLPQLVGEGALSQALDRFRESGITSVQDNTWEPFMVARLQKRARRGTLTCRFSCWPRGVAVVRHMFDLLTRFRPGDPWVRKGPVKYFADGAFAPRSAWMTVPYADDSGNVGLPCLQPHRLEAIVREAARKRIQIAFHAIGDRAVHEVLDAVEKAQVTYPWTKTLRFRLEHVQIILPEDAARMRELGIVVSSQPIALFSPDRDLRLLGRERTAHAYPYAELLAAGVSLCFGSDAPGEIDHRPLMGIYHAVTRKSADGREGPLSPEQAIDAQQALSCFTMGSAYAEFAEDEKGSITAGKLADLTLLSDDPCAIPSDRIKDIRVLQTIVGGRTVFEADFPATP